MTLRNKSAMPTAQAILIAVISSIDENHLICVAYTPTMSLKNAAFLALIGTILLTLLALVDFINTASGVLRDLIPAVAFVRSLIILIGDLSLALFFYMFTRTRP